MGDQSVASSKYFKLLLDGSITYNSQISDVCDILNTPYFPPVATHLSPSKYSKLIFVLPARTASHKCPAVKILGLSKASITLNAVPDTVPTRSIFASAFTERFWRAQEKHPETNIKKLKTINFIQKITPDHPKY